MRLAMLHSHVGDYKNEHRPVRNIATLPTNTDQWCLRQIILVAQTSWLQDAAIVVMVVV
jgi:hypothetical protein